MSGRGRLTSNRDLPDLPSRLEVVRAVRDAPERDPRALQGVTANILADHLGVEGARRHGRGAVAHSWSGTMSPSLRLSPLLRAMVREGLLLSYQKDYRHVYELTASGIALAAHEPPR